MATLVIIKDILQVDVDSPDAEYEFPCYNGMEAPEGVWSSKKFDENAIYGGVLLKSTSLNNNDSKDTILKMMLPRIQAHTRRLFLHKAEPNTDLYQWSYGSKYYTGNVEALLRLQNAGTSLEVRVRGPAKHEKECFFFLEEILGVIDQVKLISPFLKIVDCI